MTEIITSSADQVMPERAAVYENQGIPVEGPVKGETERLYTAALAQFVKIAAPVGILSAITKADFEVAYRGEGQNEPSTPVGDIFARADGLALFAVTVGEEVSREIEERFGSNDFALGCMLDSVASAATDRMADIAQSHFVEHLSPNGEIGSDTAVLRYSPGYCGWHISGQKRLFDMLHPEQIGISLRASFLMEPLKSVSGVMIAGSREIHSFPNAYPFCSQCTTQGCRKRIDALLAQ
jgi:hypothetical protein